uniref:Uncharacterized protein n=1 Tax=Arundo donax TaxID=35708 RepID=A0A0A9ABM9_ARUDO
MGSAISTTSPSCSSWLAAASLLPQSSPVTASAPREAAPPPSSTSPKPKCSTVASSLCQAPRRPPRSLHP